MTGGGLVGIGHEVDRHTVIRPHNLAMKRGSLMNYRALFVGFGVTMLLFTGCGTENPPTPTPKSLPYESTLLGRGHQIFSNTCTPCHGQNGQGISGPALWGPNSAVAGFPGFSQLEQFIQQNMPASNPGSLTPAQAQAVASFLWHQNHR
ncbi:hypothetical protein CO251_16005 [Sulfobacillus sp. hq2]|nr:hypothetical protein CO251_16005 [Sulfobacillus sp. hq2]